MEKNNEESSVSQREEKNKKVRGTMTYHTNGDAEFSAQKEGAPSQEVLKKSKTGKLYRTTSKENPKLCAYLSCDADAPDAAQRLEEQLAEFTAGFGGKPKKEPQPLARDRVLWDADDVRIWYSVKDKAVKVNLSLAVADGKNYEQETLNKVSKVYQCFSINKQYLVQRGRALKQTSKG